MSRCRLAVVVAALPLCALLVPVARSADEPEPLTIKRAGFHSCTFSPDGKTLAVSRRTIGVELRDPTTGKQSAVLKEYVAFGKVAFSPDGGMLAATGYDLSALVARERATRRRVPVKFESFREQTLAALAFDETVRIWDVQTGKTKVQLRDVEKMSQLVFSPDGKRVAAAPDYGNTVRIWDVATGKLVANWYHDEHHPTVLAFSPDGTRLAVGTSRGPIYLVNTATGGTAKTLDEHTKPVLALAFEPDGKFLHSAASNSVRRWDLATGTAELLGLRHYTEIKRMAFSPDRRFVACGDDRGGGAVWNTETGERHLDFYGSVDPITSLVFSPDGKLLASVADPFLSSSSDFNSTLTIRPINLPAKK